MKKANSTDCILDRDNDGENYENLEKKCVSENDLYRDSLAIEYTDVSDCNYLLSLNDLERMGSLRKAAEEETRQRLKDSNRNSNDIGKVRRNSSMHKPKIVGVVVSISIIKSILTDSLLSIFSTN